MTTTTTPEKVPIPCDWGWNVCFEPATVSIAYVRPMTGEVYEIRRFCDRHAKWAQELDSNLIGSIGAIPER
jgi:hypothetical protein